jgi:hypothetical protein
MAYIYSLADTWNASGTTFTGIGLNVTDTASAAGSLLMDLQVGGVSRFRVDKDATITFGSGGSYAIIDGQSATAGREILIGNTVRAVGVKDNLWVSGSYVAINPNTTFGWGSGPRLFQGDLILARDAANTLAQRNGVNAQAFNLYNSYTDVSNYERGFMRFVSNVLEIGAQAAGTGTGRSISMQTTGTFALVNTAGGSGAVNVSSTANNNVTMGFRHSTNPDGIGGGTLVGFVGRVSSHFGFFTAAGQSTLVIPSGAATERWAFFGTTASFPALRRDTTSLQARLADDSAFTNIQGKLTTETAYTAGTIVATGYLTLYDSTGTAYRVPCVV